METSVPLGSHHVDCGSLGGSGTVGLGEINRRLLKQYGANDRSSPSGLEGQGTPDVLVQLDPLEESNVSDMEEWQREKGGTDDEDEGDQEGEEEE
ncbi:hypothetical protein KI688_011988 [Linnemannia hyalina]|uniref:Uncharacterized protein n=1 Tax=Linnemannia hyalina TaxID=64524 RepID=A0A9P7XU66_9FUNG|nr:hypothetical protein KI688_011988 [Linnemannia hyalina]